MPLGLYTENSSTAFCFNCVNSVDHMTMLHFCFVQRWENALKEHIAYSTALHEGTSVSDDEDFEDIMPLGSMQDALSVS